MTLREFEARLKAITPDVSHFSARCPTAPYLVWAEDSQGESVYADNAGEDMALQGTVDLFTQREYDPLAGKVQTVLTQAGMAWRLNSIQYEDEARLYHYEWVWEGAMAPWDT